MIVSNNIDIKLEHNTKTAQEILRCLTVLYGTHTGSLALNRDFGIDWSFLDMPIETAKALFAAEIITKTQKYEPRAKIKEIQWNGDVVTGEIKPTIIIEEA